MIIVRIHGGLGNQMFQYALGLSLSVIHNDPFKIDYSYLKKINQSGRDFRLFGLSITAKEATPKEIRSYIGTTQKILDRVRKTTSKKRITEETPGFHSQILSRNAGYFDGHWQSEKYFKDIEALLRKEFSLKNPLSPKAHAIEADILTRNTPISVHIRRGDYVTNKKIASVHRTIPLSYYEEAIKKIQEKFPDAHFFISSDDIGWVKENFPKNLPTTFISNPEIPDYEEMFLMSLCKHNITANSTFSWWGAWFNRNKNKIVITPSQWFNDPARTVPDLIPASWQTL